LQKFSRKKIPVTVYHKTFKIGNIRNRNLPKLGGKKNVGTLDNKKDSDCIEKEEQSPRLGLTQQNAIQTLFW
jgi:hypothetical protein